MMPNLNFKPNNINVNNILMRILNGLLSNIKIALVAIIIMGILSSQLTLKIIDHAKKLFINSSDSLVSINSGFQITNVNTNIFTLTLGTFALLALLNIIWSECIYSGKSNDKGGLASFVFKMLATLWTCIVIGFWLLLSILASIVIISIAAILIGLVTPLLASVIPPYIISIASSIILLILVLASLALISTVPFKLLIMFAAVAVGNRLSASEACRCTTYNTNKIVAVHSILFLITLPLTSILGYILFKDDVSYLLSNVAPALAMNDIYEVQSVFEEVFLDYEPSALSMFLYSLPNALWIVLTISANTHIYEDLYPALEHKPSAVRSPEELSPLLSSSRIVTVTQKAATDTPSGHYNPFADTVDASPSDTVGTSSTSGSEAKRLV